MLRLNDFFVIKRKRENKVRIVLFVVCIVAAAFLAGTPCAYAELVPDQINGDSPLGVSIGGPGYVLSQGFTPTFGNVDTIDLRLRLGGSFPLGGYLTTINIRSGPYNGPILGSATSLVQDQGGGLFGQLVRFEFSPPVCVSPGQTYFIEWQEPLDQGILYWLGDQNNPYPGGIAWVVLAQQPSLDYCFITYANTDFPLIDRTKWAEQEFVRRIEGGALRSAFWRNGTLNYSNNLTFINPNAVNSIQAKVTLTDLVDSFGDGRAVIHGFFYNDDPLKPSSSVRAEVAIGIGGEWATYVVGRCSGPPGQYCGTGNYGGANPHIVHFVGRHAIYLSIGWEPRCYL